MKPRYDEVNTRTHRARSFLVVVLAATFAIVASSCGGIERRAERLWRQAQESVEKGDTLHAVELLQKMIDEYPDALVTAKARDQIVVYRGLANAVQSYPSRRARELMVQVARAIEAFRRENGRAPLTLAELVPAQFVSVPRDPWDRPFSYEATARGYRLRCVGADGATGGIADNADLLVVDGDFVAVQP
jgi:hypothetical protein